MHLFLTYDFMVIIINHGGLLQYIIIGIVRAHPALRHHGRGQLDQAADGWIPTPHFLLSLQERLSLIFGRDSDQGQGILSATGPVLKLDGALPGGPDNGHGHDTGTGFLTIEFLIGLADNLFGGEILSISKQGSAQKYAYGEN